MGRKQSSSLIPWLQPNPLQDNLVTFPKQPKDTTKVSSGALASILLNLQENNSPTETEMTKKAKQTLIPNDIPTTINQLSLTTNHPSQFHTRTTWSHRLSHPWDTQIYQHLRGISHQHILTRLEMVVRFPISSKLKGRKENTKWQNRKLLKIQLVPSTAHTGPRSISTSLPSNTHQSATRQALSKLQTRWSISIQPRKNPPQDTKQVSSNPGSRRSEFSLSRKTIFWEKILGPKENLKEPLPTTSTVTRILLQPNRRAMEYNLTRAAYPLHPSKILW